MTDTATQDIVPAAAIERRDDFGRLVAVTWHGAGVGGVTRTKRWRVVVDGSASSLRAIAATTLVQLAGQVIPPAPAGFATPAPAN